MYAGLNACAHTGNGNKVADCICKKYDVAFRQVCDEFVNKKHESIKNDTLIVDIFLALSEYLDFNYKKPLSNPQRLLWISHSSDY